MGLTSSKRERGACALALQDGHPPSRERLSAEFLLVLRNLSREANYLTIFFSTPPIVVFASYNIEEIAADNHISRLDGPDRLLLRPRLARRA